MTTGAHANLPLSDFIGANRAELIQRCKVKVAQRSGPQPPEAEIDRGVPLFLDQLVRALHNERLDSREINKGATEHGHDLLLKGFSVSQVVHDYGDVCQSVTDLAVETNAPISTDEFRTLNRCLDDAIAGAVTAHAREQEASREEHSDRLRTLIDKAITAFEVLLTGSVGVRGNTGAIVYGSLVAIRTALAGRSPEDATDSR